MALTYAELESITHDFFIADNKRAIDNYFKTSFLLDYFLNKQKGIWKRPPGGKKVRVGIEFDEAEGNFYDRNDPLSSDDRETLNAAYFLLKHCYGNATLLRTDELEAAGPYEEVDFVISKVEGAQKTITKKMAGQIYSSAADGATVFPGIYAMCGETASSKYGGVAEDDLVSADGTKVWEGKTTTTSEAISLAVIRTAASAAKVRDGAKGKPGVGTMPETLFNKIKAILQTQQRFTTDKDTVKAGFQHVVFEGMILAADDFIASDAMCLINEAFYGWAVHAKGYYEREPWQRLQNVAGRSMKIFFDGSPITSLRKSHILHTNLS